MRKIETMGRSALIFDMDGTLMNSMIHWRETIRREALSGGVELPEDFYIKIKPQTPWEVANTLVDVYHVPGDPKALLQSMNARITEAYRTEVQLKPGIDEVLATYKDMGLKMAVFTASDRKLIDAALNSLDIAKYFDESWSLLETGGSKDDIASFDKVLGSLGASREQALVFEDGTRGARTAKAHGIATIGIWDETATDEEALLKEIVDRYIYTWDELFID